MGDAVGAAVIPALLLACNKGTDWPTAAMAIAFVVVAFGFLAVYTRSWPGGGK